MKTTDSQEYKVVARFSDPMPAEILAGMLRENGIPAGVFGAVSSYPCLNYAHPIEVKVNAEDYEKALALVPEEDRFVED